MTVPHLSISPISRAAGASAVERGPTGHTNGLVRGYLPKGKDLRRMTDASSPAPGLAQPGGAG